MDVKKLHLELNRKEYKYNQIGRAYIMDDEELETNESEKYLKNNRVII